MDDSDRTQIRELKDLIGPAKPEARQAYLIVISGSEIGRMHAVKGDTTVIGRSRTAQMVVEDAGVSRNHVEVLASPEGVLMVRDLGSTNGSLLNGTPLSADPVALTDGDRIQVGTAVLLKFSYGDHLDETFQKHLYSSAVRDGLTEAYNKRYLAERMEQEFAYAGRHKVPFSIVVIDLDHFKQVNDTRGHACGDYVLKTLAKVIGNRMRKEEVLARYGGEEFVVLLREADLAHAGIFAERIRELVASTPLVWQGAEFRVTISVGVASTSTKPYESVHALFERADQLMYQAKRAGRNRVQHDV
jgi:two-component system, cell cycle response regulator